MPCKPHVSYNSGQNEWYTPENIIELVHKAMGKIDLDVASSAKANEIVRAEKYFSADDSALEKQWDGKIFMNPPYSQPLIKQFAEKFCEQYENIDEAIIIVNNATETEWFQLLAMLCDVIVFPKGRMRFYSPDGKKTGHPLQGQAVLYMGEHQKEFLNIFSEIGFGVIL